MFLLNREIAEAFKANTEAREALTEALKDLEKEVSGMKEALKHTEGKMDGQTETWARLGFNTGTQQGEA